MGRSTTVGWWDELRQWMQRLSYGQNRAAGDQAPAPERSTVRGQDFRHCYWARREPR